jgi:hypothetical protein
VRARREGDADRIVAESEKILLELFQKLNLTPAEKEFVNHAARRLSNTAWELLMDVPDAERAKMRGVITSLAIAMAGGWNELQ